MHCEAALHIVDDPEVFASLVDLDDIHEAGGKLGVGPGLAIDLDQPLLHDSLHLLHAQRILHAYAVPDTLHVHFMKIAIKLGELNNLSMIRYYLAKQVSFL